MKTKTRRIGPSMRMVAYYADQPDGIAIIDCARKVGPHGSLCYGYHAVNRAIRAGCVVRIGAKPGRRGGSVITPERYEAEQHARLAALAGLSADAPAGIVADKLADLGILA